MAKKMHNSDCKDKQSPDKVITEKQIEIFARRLLPEVKKFYAEEDVRLEFESWQRKQQKLKYYNK